MSVLVRSSWCVCVSQTPEVTLTNNSALCWPSCITCSRGAELEHGVLVFVPLPVQTAVMALS